MKYKAWFKLFFVHHQFFHFVRPSLWPLLIFARPDCYLQTHTRKFHLQQSKVVTSELTLDNLRRELAESSNSLAFADWAKLAPVAPAVPRPRFADCTILLGIRTAFLEKPLKQANGTNNCKICSCDLEKSSDLFSTFKFNLTVTCFWLPESLGLRWTWLSSCVVQVLGRKRRRGLHLELGSLRYSKIL